jgi:hypothetical protein
MKLSKLYSSESLCRGICSCLKEKPQISGSCYITILFYLFYKLFEKTSIYYDFLYCIENNSNHFQIFLPSSKTYDKQIKSLKKFTQSQLYSSDICS